MNSEFPRITFSSRPDTPCCGSSQQRMSLEHIQHLDSTLTATAQHIETTFKETDSTATATATAPYSIVETNDSML